MQTGWTENSKAIEARKARITAGLPSATARKWERIARDLQRGGKRAEAARAKMGGLK